MTVTSDFWRGVDVCSICIDLDERVLTGEEKRRSKGLYCIWAVAIYFFFVFLNLGCIPVHLENTMDKTVTRRQIWKQWEGGY